MDARLIALIALLGSLVLGAILAVVARSVAARLAHPTNLNPRGIGRMVFLLSALVGVVVSLAILDEQALEAIPEQALAFVPRLLGAGVLLVSGWLLSNLAARLVDQAIARGTGRSIPLASRVARWSVLGTAIILALGQLGIETMFLVIATTIALSSIGLVLSLLVVAAGRDLATQAAHGRYLRRQIAAGDNVRGEGFAGSVVRVTAASTLLRLDSGEQLMVPNTHLTDRPVTIRKA